jgi:galactoside O-acetyltransferase
MRNIGGRFLERSELEAAGFASLGENVLVHETSILIDVGSITLGSNVRIDPFCLISAAGGSVSIGNFVHVAAQACIFGKGGVVMEDFSGLSQAVKVYSVSDDYSGASLTNPTVPQEFVSRVTTGPVRLARHVIVGSGSVILPSVVIGEGSSVGALSLVNKSLDSWGVYVGSPARRVRDRSQALLADERRLFADPRYCGR